MASQEEQEITQRLLHHHFNTRNLNLKFLADIISHDKSKPPRTNKNLIQFRLLEAGVSYEILQPLWEIHGKLYKFVQTLEKSGCYEQVNVEIEQIDQKTEPTLHRGTIPPTEQLKVILKERNWYQFYVGGGIRNDIQFEEGQVGVDMLARTQFETSARFKNLTGNLDTTNLQYTVDATAQSRWGFHHIRPLDGILIPMGINVSPYLNAGDFSVGFYASLDSLDYEWTRSYRERQRRVALRLSNHGQVQNPDTANGPYIGCEWAWLFRDILPRRHATVPYALDASPEIAAQSGPSEKNSLTWEYRTNGSRCDHKFNPEAGVDYYSKLEVAGPPGEVGFVKAQGGGAVHIPFSCADRFQCSLHGAFHTGFLQSLSYGGTCRPATVSDRFFIGGPLQLRGFCPAGIGPRAKIVNKTATPQGDALGGDFFYTATLAASTTTDSLARYGIRVLAFGNFGTLGRSVPSGPSWHTIARSSRASVGLGICGGLPMGRVEATYAWPIRFGPRDIRKNVQFGLGLSFG